MTVQDSALPGPAPFNWNTGNGTAAPITGTVVTPPRTQSTPAPAIPSPAPAPGGGGQSTPSASSNPGAGGLQFSPPPSGSTSTSQSTVGTAPSSDSTGGAPPASAPVHYAGLSSSPIPGAAPGGVNALAAGGNVDPDNDGDVHDDPVTAAVNQAMETVSSLFDFGRQKHGLGGGGDQAPMGGTWGQMPNTSGPITPTPEGRMIGGSPRPGEINPTPLHDDDSDTGYSSPTATGLPAPKVQGAKRGGAIASYADGGSVDDDAGGPDVEDAAQGGQQSQQGNQQPQQGVPGQVQQGIPTGQGSPKRAIGYLTGEGAMPSQNVMALEQKVDPHGQMPPEIRKLLAVHAAAQQGPEAGWAAMQHYRQRFLMLNGVAAAQMKGNQQKPGNPALAAKTATDAYSNSLDGNRIAFQPNPQGMTVHVQPYKRPTQRPSMSRGGAIPSYADGGSVGFADSDTPDAPFLGQEVNFDQQDTTGSTKPQGGIPGQGVESDRSAQTRDGVPITRGGASSGLGGMLKQGIYNITHPYFMKLTTNAAGHDELQENGPAKYFDENSGVNMAGPQPADKPAAPSPAPSAQQGAPAPTAPTGKQEGTDQAIKGGAAEQPTGEKEDYKGKLIQIGGDNGPKVYENLWRLAQTQFPWASQQREAMDMYHRLATGQQVDEAKVAAAELKGTQQAGLVAQRNAGALERNVNTNATRQEANDIRRTSVENRKQHLQEAHQEALMKIANQVAQGDKNREASIVRAGLQNFGMLPPEIQKAVNDETMSQLSGALKHVQVQGVGGGLEAQAPQGAQAPQAGQGTSAQNAIPVNDQAGYENVPSGQWISFKGSQPFQKK